ncbi:MAG: hypothetical protein WCR06_01735 [bacterium]
MIALILATSREAAPLLARAGRTRDERPASRPVFVDLRPAHDLVLYICGMGPEQARVGVTRLLQQHAVTAVVNVGVAGAVADNLALEGMYRITKTCLWPATETLYTSSGDRWPELPAAVLATVAQPVFDPVRRAEIARHAELVDMEGAAIAQCCQARGVPWYAIKGVTDLAGEQDRSRLHRNLDRVSERLADLVWQVVG